MNPTKKLALKIILLIVLSIFLILMFVSCSKAQELNNYMFYSQQYFRQKDRTQIDENMVVSFARFELKVEEASWLEKVFFSYKDEYKILQTECTSYVETCAQTISKEIAALESCTEIRSANHYHTMRDQISKLTLSADDPFEKLVLEKIENYDKLESYAQQLETVQAKYKSVCTICNGKGRETKTCSSCNGKGKKLVTFYEYGDWGDTSYSSYKCTSCNGTGKTSWSCSCDDGYVYDYGN